MNGENVTVAGLLGSIVTDSDSSSRSLSSSDTRRFSTVSFPRFASRAVTAARSRPENRSRCTDAPATLTLATASSSDTEIGISTVPGGSKVFAALSTPTRWKSLISAPSSSG